MEAIQILNRSEMKKIGGGYMEACRIYGSSGWSSCSFNSNDASGWYHSFDDITGYCCASCGTGNFSNASPC